MLTIKHFSFKEPDYPFHFWLIQFTAFAYLIYRLLSRDYSVYGLVDEQLFEYPRWITHIYPPGLTVELLNFHWIYTFVSYPGVEVIWWLQLFVLLFAVCGILGIFVKASALLSFFGYLHMVGFVQATNAEIDGGSLCLATLLVVCIANKSSYYSLFKKNPIAKNTSNRWPVYILFLLVGAFYTFAGLNKLIDVGPHWPFSLHLDYWADAMRERSVFVSSRYVYPELAYLLDHYWFSVLSGFLTLIVEIGFIAILFFPRGRLFLVSSMIVLHTLVYATMGTYFLGTTFIVLLCFDWNAPFRKSNVYFDQDCGICTFSVWVLKKLDIFHRIQCHPMQSIDNGEYGFSSNRLKQEMGDLEEDGSIYYGAEAFEKVFEKIPFFYPIALLYKLPLVIYLADFIYKLIAKNRYRISGSDSCSIDE